MTATSAARPSDEELVREYERLASLAESLPSRPGRATTFGWDLEYTSPDALPAFVDQILYRRLNDFVSRSADPVILDCGANIGYTVLHYKRLFPGARITAFEPDPEFAPILRRNLERNGAAEVPVVEAAVWTRRGHAQWVMEGKDGSRLVNGCQRGGGRIVEVPTVDLADYIDGPVDLLKVDIEGAEFEVIPHLAGRLQLVRNVLVECHITDQRKYVALANLMNVLTDAGFSISVNSYGPWRDLTRRHTPPPLHAEQYLLVAGWRGDESAVDEAETYVPYVGASQARDRRALESRIQHLEDEVRRRDAVDADNQMLRSALAAVANGTAGWQVCRLAGPFTADRGACWRLRLPDGVRSGDSLDSKAPPTILMEDDRVLGPGRALHDDIRRHGAGRYSHWERTLYFSTSDNSDPNANGRSYVALIAGGDVDSAVFRNVP